MGQLNSNDIPPNPFVHGWNEPDLPPTLPPTPRSTRTITREEPSPTRAPQSSQRTNAVSPLQRAHEIVSQPLPPARPPQSSFWPAGLIFAAIVTVASLLFLAANPHGQTPRVQTHTATNQVAASATPLPTSLAPVVMANRNVAQENSRLVEENTSQIQTHISNSSSPESTPQPPVPAEAQPPQDEVQASPVQSIPALPVIAGASTVKAESKPVEIATPLIQSPPSYSSASTPAQQSPAIIQAQLPPNAAPVFAAQRMNGSTDNQGEIYSGNNGTSSPHSSKPTARVFRTVGKVISLPVVIPLKIVGGILTGQQVNERVYVAPQNTTFVPIVRTSGSIPSEYPAYPANVRYAPAPAFNGSPNGRVIYVQQQPIRVNPVRIYYNQTPPIPVTTYQPRYQQPMYYGAPQVIRVPPNQSQYMPNMNGPGFQRRAR